MTAYPKKELLSQMLLLATTKHHGQFDKAGQPYILHCLKVMHYVNSSDEVLNCIALGHDLLEDTDVTYKELFENFGARIAIGIWALTKYETISPETYIQTIINNPDASRVKLADLKHNSDIRRLKGLSAKDFERMKKYAEMYTKIKEASQNRLDNDP